MLFPRNESNKVILTGVREVFDSNSNEQFLGLFYGYVNAIIRSYSISQYVVFVFSDLLFVSISRLLNEGFSISVHSNSNHSVEALWSIFVPSSEVNYYLLTYLFYSLFWFDYLPFL